MAGDIPSPPSRPSTREKTGDYQSRMRAGTAEPTQPVPRNVPTDPAARARYAAAESAQWVREEASQLLTNYKKQSKYFKWRFWLVAAYVGVSAGSLLAIVPPMNSINAYVRVTRNELDGKPVILVRNDSTTEWTHVRVMLNDHYVFERDRLRATDEVTPDITQFRKEGTTGPDAKPLINMALHSLRVKCDQGSFKQSLN